MSILLDLVHHIYDDAYPLVKTIINDVKGIAHADVERAKEKIVVAAEQVEKKAEAVIEHVEERVEKVEEDLSPWGFITAQILDARAAQRSLQERTDYDWRSSPTDLLKLVKRPEEADAFASFSNRQTLARLFDMPKYSGTEGQGEELLKHIKEWLGI